jgi:hypothetical protein
MMAHGNAPIGIVIYLIAARACSIFHANLNILDNRSALVWD